MRRFENINLLRAFAALTVVVYHVIELGHWSSFPVHGPLLAFRIGWIGLDLFFVISGFVITYSAILLQGQDPDGFARKYWSRRLTRIVPLHLLTMAVWIAVAVGFFDKGLRGWGWQILTHVAFIHNFWPATYGSINGVNWTLAVEMQFYLAVALLVPWLARTPGWRIWLVCAVIAWAWRGAMVVLHASEDSWHLFMAVSRLPGQLDEFGAGIFLAKLVLAKRRRRTIEALPWLLGACAFGYLAMRLYWPHASYWNFPWMVVFWHSVLALFLLCVVACAIWLPQTLATRWLKPFDYLGEISYGIYLWQLVAIDAAMAIAGPRPPVVLVVTLALTIVVSALSWRFFEKPIMGLARTPSWRLRNARIAD
ncbi:MAG TPA: acyltransferase [Casimicrobiaceae bacterium]|nr:acyltransferase [Casimicrobiaceae bacterium]